MPSHAGGGAGNSRARSQRKAAGLATAAITLQSHDNYDGSHSPHVGGLAGVAAGGSSVAASLTNRPLTVRERMALDEERMEREQREQGVKRRKLNRRLDELERTNHKDGAGTSRAGTDASRNDGEGFSIPNSVLAAAMSAQSSSLPNSAQAPHDVAHFEMALTATQTSARKQSAGVRRLLTYRRGFHALLEDAMADETFSKASANYLTASATAARDRELRQAGLTSLRDARPLFCTICGAEGQVSCPRCDSRTCVAVKCLETHNDTRCDRPIR